MHHQLGIIGEVIAVIHWLSLLYALDQWASMASEHGLVGGTVLFLIISFLTGMIAEAIESRIPTILRPIRRLIRAILDLLL